MWTITEDTSIEETLKMLRENGAKLRQVKNTPSLGLHKRINWKRNKLDTYVVNGELRKVIKHLRVCLDNTCHY